MCARNHRRPDAAAQESCHATGDKLQAETPETESRRAVTLYCGRFYLGGACSEIEIDECMPGKVFSDLTMEIASDTCCARD